MVQTPFLHLLTHDPHPGGNPLHEVLNGGRKQDPMVDPVLTWHEFCLHVTWQDSLFPFMMWGLDPVL